MGALLADLPLPAGSADPATGGGAWSFVRLILSGVVLNNNVVPDHSPWPATLWTFPGVALAFLVTRAVTRLIRRRGTAGEAAHGPVKDIVIGGVHLHHQVFGIVLMALSGVLLVAVQPVGAPLGVLAAVLGVGIGLAFDELALWFYLDDVYWSERGRASIDAVALVLVAVGEITVIVGFAADVEANSELARYFGPGVFWVEGAVVALTVLPALVCLLKGKPFAAGIGIAYIPVGVIGMVRLAKPGSWWAHRLYATGGSRSQRSGHRFGARYRARWNRVRDLVGGAPSDEARPPA